MHTHTHTKIHTHSFTSTILFINHDVLDYKAAIGHLAAPEHAEDLRSIRTHLAKVADIKRLLRKARTSARLKPQEWAKVAASCDALGQLHALASRRADCAPIFEAIAAGFDSRVSKLGNTIERYEYHCC